MTARLWCLGAGLLSGLCAHHASAGVAPAPVTGVRATASSSGKGGEPGLAVDGMISDTSRWFSQTSKDPAWLELDLGGRRALSGLHVHAGTGGRASLREFGVQFQRDGVWVDIPSAMVRDNTNAAVAVAFDATVDVTTDRLRLWITGTEDGVARVREVVVWPLTPGGMPSLADAAGPPTLIFLNQSGFNTGAPKRFTAPTVAEGTPFEVRPAAGGPAIHTGVVRGSIGDFSAFEPRDAREYVVAAGSLVSVPFRVGDWWLERVTYQNAVNFMIDSRHYVGNVRGVCRGSFGWRDDHHFGWELHTLVPQFLSNPSAYTRMPRQISVEPSDERRLWGALEPPRADAPDLVKLIHWGADIIVTQGLTHEHLKAQLAYFLYAWPWLRAWLPEQNYTAVRDYAFARWAAPEADRKYPYDESPDNNLLALKTRLGTTKGSLPPGASVEPNLLMHEVARREKRPDAALYLDAAVRQAEWMVEHLDWNDPQVTKGQRMSEWITVTGLVHLLRVHPDRAPAGLAAKLEEWARVVIRRADNLWDFRKLDDGDGWTPMGDGPTKWNEPGNVLGLPAALLAVQTVLTNVAVNARLEQLVWSHFDNGFGRNPTGRHFSYDAPREIEGVETGWYSFLPGGIGQLANARFVIDGSPKNPHYPFHPEAGNVGWTEGWVQFNTAFNVSLAYLANATTRIQARRDGNELAVRLEAPLNFDAKTVESAAVLVTSPDGDTETVTVKEESADSRWLSGRLPLANGGAAVPNDGRLQAARGRAVDVSYGHGWLACRATVRP